MAIKIQTQDTHIPIELGELTLKFSVTDDSLVQIRSKFLKLQDAVEKLEMSDDEKKALEQLQGMLRNAYDELFGEGTFDQVYKKWPSVLTLAEYFAQITNGITEELNSRGFALSGRDKAKEYLAKKKK